MDALLSRLRTRRWANIAIINLRFLIGFAFLPAALKKILDEPFTDPANSGRFHDFLDHFYATGAFYRFVGIVQLVAAVLLCTQRFALAGAFIALPVLTAIMVFCWSTGVVPTATVATLMWLGTLALLIWDLPRWRGIFARSPDGQSRLWAWCGVAICALYVGLCLVHGGMYRPRGMDLRDPAFYVLPTIALLPVITYLAQRRH